MKLRASSLFIALTMSLAVSTLANAAGSYLSSGGPVSQSMGGASTAAPLDAIGALYWNPATTSALAPELGFGVGLLQPILNTSSSIPGLGGGTTDAEPGVAALPNVGWVYREQGSPLTIGLGVHAVAGYKTNYPASTTNPLFLPQSNTPGIPGGLGGVNSGADFLQVAPTMSLALSDRLSVSAGPTLTLGSLLITPLLTAAPDDADGSGAATYPSGRGSRIHWGGGFQLGVYFIGNNCWHYGASIKSPQWMEDFRFKTENELGLPIINRVALDLPMIISLGTAYSGYENIVFAMDARYYDYKNTDGWGPSGFNADGSLKGLGQSNVLEVAFGAQFKLSEKTFARGGYTYNQNPFQSAEATVAALAPLIYQHQIHMGMTRYLSDAVALNFAYSYWPENTITGPLVTALGPIPGSTVRSELDVHHLNLGLSVRY